MLKRLLAVAALTVGLVLAPVMGQVPVQADECWMFVYCSVTPEGSDCIEILICIIGGG